MPNIIILSGYRSDWLEIKRIKQASEYLGYSHQEFSVEDVGWSLLKPIKDYKKDSVIVNRLGLMSQVNYIQPMLSFNRYELFNNPSVTTICDNKALTTACFESAKIQTTPTIWIPITNHPRLRVKTIRKSIINNIESHFDYPVVIKPTGGGRGWKVTFIKNREELDKYLYDDKRILANPWGLYVQKYKSHIADIRVVVGKKKGSPLEIFGALFRIPLKEHMVANTSQGNPSVKFEISDKIRSLSYNMCQSVLDGATLLDNVKDRGILLGIDILVNTDNMELKNTIRGLASQLKNSEEYNLTHKKKQFKVDFEAKDKKFHSDMAEYMDLDVYHELGELLTKNTPKAELFASEANATLDFGDLTHVFSEGKIARGIVECAVSNLY
ncbi:MAG: ATP-grasp domain-containing protein [Promethearchaeota archaeon]|jgi:glutathione synthase/RimK-type ligase-like ATP-grasp enzyme